MTNIEVRKIGRRALLGTTAAAAAGAAVAATPNAEAGQDKGGQARESFRVVDRRGRQRFLASAHKPPAIMNGQTFPRSGPDGTYLIVNDGNGDERGGIVAAANAASVSLDYANAQAITLASRWAGKDDGQAVLFMKAMPDPTLPVDRVPATPTRAVFGYGTREGAFLTLHDSQGRPRIVLEVDGSDTPQIKILDPAGRVIRRL